MILTDTGPLVAIINKGDSHHERCVSTLSKIHKPLTTTWPVFTEAMYILGTVKGWVTQDALWRLMRSGGLSILPSDEDLLERMYVLMDKYSDTPMDLADASLVALAEQLDTRRIFTLDSDFKIYRISGKHLFEIIPE